MLAMDPTALSGDLGLDAVDFWLGIGSTLIFGVIARGWGTRGFSGRQLPVDEA